jgi:hypothetical protein
VSNQSDTIDNDGRQNRYCARWQHRRGRATVGMSVEYLLF